ncbi:DUF945 family protein [Fundidesulfovibrio agrisoli]|uniref:DUF945 family protein n=1 Tax=Fundidesulfovibrio agrisoli TaxID=2922717 RepID=UPI001FADE3D4
MKKSFLAVLFAATAYMAVTVFVAFNAGGTIDAALKQAFAESPTLRFSPKGSSIGIFSSSYTYNLGFSTQPNGPEAPALTVTFDVAHGPIPFAAGSFSPCAAVVNTRFSLAKNTPEAARAALEQVPELLNTKLRAEAGFGGSLDILLTVPPLFRDTPQRQEFQGAKVSVLTDTCFSSHTTKADIPLISLQDDSYTFLLKGLTIRSDAVKLRPYVWHGESTLKLAGLALSTKDTTPPRSFTLENLAVPGKTVLHGPTIDASFSLSGVTSVNNSAPLPLFFSTTLYNLDLDGFSQLYGLLQREYGGGGDAVRPYVDEVRKTYDLLLARSPRVEIEMKALAGTPNEIAFKGEASAPELKSVPPTPQEALAQLRAKADLSAQEQGLVILVDTFSSPEEKESQVQQQQLQTALQQLTEKGFLTRDGSSIKASAVWDGKALMVNGKLVQ